MRSRTLQFGAVVSLGIPFLAWGGALAQPPALVLTLHVKQGAMDQTGLAFANPTSTPASIQIFLFRDAGTFASTQTPRIDIPPNQQRAATLSELFPDAGDVQGLVVGLADNTGLVGFFLTFAPGVSQIDGAEALISNSVGRSVIFPEMLTGPGERTQLHVMGVQDGDNNPMTLHFDLCGEDGTCQRRTRSLRLGFGFLIARFSEDVRTLFGDAALAAPGAHYVKVSSPDGGVSGYQEFRGADFRGGRNAVESPSGSSRPAALFGAQIADTGAITTDVRLINPAAMPVQVNLSLFGTGVSDTTPVASASLVIPAGGVVKGNIRDLAQLPAGDFVGWLRVDSDVTGLIGNVTFFDPAKTFLSSVQMEGIAIKEIVYSHVADGEGFFTGLTFLNPSPDPTSVDIQVFSPDGVMTGSSTFLLAGFEHTARLLGEIIPGFQPQVNGFIKMTASGGIFSFEQFGFVTGAGLTSLSAVPPQRGAATVSGKVLPAAQSPSPGSLSADDGEARLRRLFPNSWRNGVALDPEDEFRPGECIVRMRNGMAASAVHRVAREWGFGVAAQAPGQVSLLRVEAGMASLQEPAVGAGLKQQTVRVIEMLNQRADVVYAQPNYVYRAAGAGIPDDPLLERMWHLNAVFVPQAWEVTTGRSDIVIAVLDSGAKFAHPDLGPRLTGGQADFILDSRTSLDGDGRDLDADDPGSDPTGLGSRYHGTHVAGTIGAVTNNALGVAGINQVSPLMTLRVLGAGGGTEFDIWEAALFSVGLPNVLGPQPPEEGFVPARVLNMSLGSPDTGPFARSAATAVLSTGAIIVASAGNSNSDALHFPADLPGVFKIGATGPDGGKAPYSNFGRNDFVAPGGDTSDDIDGDGFPDGVLSTLWNQVGNDPRFDFYQGTSMAAPHVTGIISLMLSANPNLTRQQVEAILQETSILPVQLEASGAGAPDPFYGHGIVNAFGAVAAAANLPLTDPRLALSPALLDFRAVDGELAVGVINLGGGTLTLETPQVETDSGGGWLAADVDLEVLTVRVDRSALADGIYRGRIHLQSNGGQATVQVRMRVGVDSNSDIGDILVWALDPGTGTRVGQTTARFDNFYRYDMPLLPAGDYVVTAGTDSDDDSVICEEGEFCGSWPVTSRPEVLTVRSGEDRQGVNFTVAADTGLAATPSTTLPSLRVASRIRLTPVVRGLLGTVTQDSRWPASPPGHR